MGNNKKKRAKQRKVSAQGKPFVSICTPTYNRKKFIPFLIKCYLAQTYPRELMEWVVVDDGDDFGRIFLGDPFGFGAFSIRYVPQIFFGPCLTSGGG